MDGGENFEPCWGVSRARYPSIMDRCNRNWNLCWHSRWKSIEIYMRYWVCFSLSLSLSLSFTWLFSYPRSWRVPRQLIRRSRSQVPENNSMNKVSKYLVIGIENTHTSSEREREGERKKDTHTHTLSLSCCFSPLSVSLLPLLLFFSFFFSSPFKSTSHFVATSFFYFYSLAHLTFIRPSLHTSIHPSHHPARQTYTVHYWDVSLLSGWFTRLRLVSLHLQQSDSVWSSLSQPCATIGSDRFPSGFKHGARKRSPLMKVSSSQRFDHRCVEWALMYVENQCRLFAREGTSNSSARFSTDWFDEMLSWLCYDWSEKYLSLVSDRRAPSILR